MKSLNIIDTAIRTGIFQTFTRLLEDSDLERRLRSPAYFTLFAPVDISFAYLPPKTLTHLLRAENQGILSDLLSYHVVPRAIDSAALRDLRMTPTIYGADLSIEGTNELRVNGARVLHVDIFASNGVIHGIDRLLMPAKSAAVALQ